MKILAHALTLVFFLNLGCVVSPKSKVDSCAQVRAAFDIGSGSTKVHVAEVDICKGSLRKKIWTSSIATAYQEDLLSTGEKRIFTQNIKQQGQANFAKLLLLAKTQGATQAAGVATHAFREARNGAEFIAELEHSARKHLPTHLSLISQETELRLGLVSGLVTAQIPPETAIVWDIGGGSQQMSARDPAAPEKLLTFEGDLASTRFMESFPLHSDGKRKTPNPIGLKSAQEGIQRARQSARSSVPPALRKRLTETDTVIGIGGVLGKSVRDQVGKNPFTADDIEVTLTAKASLSDQELGGQYANTQVSNLILVLGFMRELQIRQVLAVDANLATGVLVSKEFWKDFSDNK